MSAKKVDVTQKKVFYLDTNKKMLQKYFVLKKVIYFFPTARHITK